MTKRAHQFKQGETVTIPNTGRTGVVAHRDSARQCTVRWSDGRMFTYYDATLVYSK